jgi:hypothetical protein
MENDGGAGLGRGLTGAATVRFASRDGKGKKRPCDRVQNRSTSARGLDDLGTSRVRSLTEVHHFPIMPLEFRSRKEENPWKLVQSTLAKLF